MEQVELLNSLAEMQNLYNCFERLFGSFQLKLSIHILADPAILLIDKYPTEMGKHVH